MNHIFSINYGSDILKIEQGKSGYSTYINDKKESGEYEDQDIYFYALDFVHERRKDIKELVVYDTYIISADHQGITYFDDEGRKHFIEYSVCANNYSETHKQTITCVGERDITKMFFKFYTSNMPIKILFKSPFVFKKKKHFLIGSKKKRFGILQQAVIDGGYTTYDLS